MFDTFKKAWVILRTRPASFLGYFGQYFRFARTRMFRFLTYSQASGVTFGENVRIQSLTAMSAERPGASITVGNDSVIYEKAQIGAYGTGTITIGEATMLGDVRIYARSSITLGNRVITSWNVFIQDFDPHPVDPETRGEQIRYLTSKFRPSYRTPQGPETFKFDFPVAPITIGDDVWLGANTTILKGAHIGNGCVVATGCVVLAGHYPDRSIIGGVPGRVLSTIK